MLDNYKTTFQGRVKSVRKHKSCAFIDMDTKDGIMQLCFGQNVMNKIPMRGDIISVAGTMSKTRTGQDTLFIDEVSILNSSQNPDIVDYSLKDLILERSGAENAIRTIMNQNNIVPVSTAVLSEYRGTSKIQPFETVDIKGCPFFMKFTHELGLKRIMTDTQLPVYELGKVFRNMGKGQRYYREYTVLEVQIPYKGLDDGIQIVKDIASTIADTEKFAEFKSIPTYTMEEMFYDLGVDFWTLDESTQRNIYKTKIKKLPGPFFLTNPPYQWSPLTLKAPDGKTALDAELIYRGRGIAHICEERYRYEDIKNGLLSKEHKDGVDKEFLKHMSAGTPPSVGFAFGLDRFIATLRNIEMLKEVIPYAR